MWGPLTSVIKYWRNILTTPKLKERFWIKLASQSEHEDMTLIANRILGNLTHLLT